MRHIFQEALRNSGVDGIFHFRDGSAIISTFRWGQSEGKVEKRREFADSIHGERVMARRVSGICILGDFKWDLSGNRRCSGGKSERELKIIC